MEHISQMHPESTKTFYFCTNKCCLQAKKRHRWIMYCWQGVQFHAPIGRHPSGECLYLHKDFSESVLLLGICSLRDHSFLARLVNRSPQYCWAVVLYLKHYYNQVSPSIPPNASASRHDNCCRFLTLLLHSAVKQLDLLCLNNIKKWWVIALPPVNCDSCFNR